MPTPGAADQDVLHKFHEELRDESKQVVVEMFLWTLYLVVAIYALIIQVKRSSRSIAHMVLLASTILLFVMSTSLLCARTALSYLRMEWYFSKHPDWSLEDRYTRYFEYSKTWRTPIQVVWTIHVILGDGIVIWRAWVVWKNNRVQRLVFIPMSFLLVSVAFLIIANLCNAISHPIPEDSQLCLWRDAVPWAISLITHVVSTVFIAVRVWQWRSLVQSGDSNPSKSKIWKTMALLVESGCAYVLVWVFAIFVQFGPVLSGGGVEYLYRSLAPLSDQLTGLYPTVIIVLVKLRLSVDDRSVANSSQSDSRYERAPQLTSIRFTPPTSTSPRSVSSDHEYELNIMECKP
ncbi:hypothetical protein CYLTODRAFT_402780 [Cylindrobasidium torrendii FP15055 ss-10]|uniref:Family A G protein-coupled receptor-like protein n=1 Tax=Cylindrobasidium torrendii FP15055 ss-10 TaxID=1314674 RepID=A0A0D7B2G2_9AGAR|nr:hypothetical protein CYLTODRAFT_402780 [Cylindrobasidium torrendii FP15055 ss-10]